MIVKIQPTKARVYKALLTKIRKSKNKEFLIWEFSTTYNENFVGFTSSQVTFGNKTYIWFSLLSGYFLPLSYTINFENIIGTQCYIILDPKKVVRTIIPIGVEIKNLELEKEGVTSSTELDKTEEVNIKEQKEEISGEDLFT